MNIGEQICGDWLRYERGCDFVQFNVKTSFVQGEVDVVGINLAKQHAYACEVAVHLVTGLQYVKGGRPDNVDRLVAKLKRDIRFLREAFPGYEHTFMIWSPVVKNQADSALYNQMRDIREIVSTVQRELGVSVVSVINEQFMDALGRLRDVARRETKELESPVMRYLQIEEHLSGHLARLRQPG